MKQIVIGTFRIVAFMIKLAFYLAIVSCASMLISAIAKSCQLQHG